MTTIDTLLGYWAGYCPDKTAIVFGDRRVTFAEHHQRVLRHASGLRPVAAQTKGPLHPAPGDEPLCNLLPSAGCGSLMHGARPELPLQNQRFTSSRRRPGGRRGFTAQELASEIKHR